MDDLRLYLFGSPRLERAGSLVEMDTRKALALLAVLALSGKEQQRDSLAALLYPEAEPESARAAFRRTLSTLNHALGSEVLAVRREAVGLNPAAGLWVDVLQFKRFLGQQPTFTALAEAASLYREDFLAGFSLRDSPAFDDWQYQQSEDLRRLLVITLEKLATLAATSGDFESAIQFAARQVGLDSLLEEGHRQLMQIYAQAGQRNAALRQYRQCVRILEEELGVTPLEETTHLYQEILSGKWDPRREKPALPGPSLERSEGTAADRLKPPQPVVSPLVGRAAEWKALLAALETPSPTGCFIGLEGEAGIGKTRLAEEFLAQVHLRGGFSLQARCFEGESGLAFAPILSGLSGALAQPEEMDRLKNVPAPILAEAAPLLPSLNSHFKDLPQPLPPDSAGAQARFFEALRQVIFALLGSDRPNVLFLDDLQWADSATLDLLTYLVRRLDSAQILILAAWRNDATPAAERLRQLIGETARNGRSCHITLARLNPKEIGQLVQTLLPEQKNISADLSQRLYRESEGLPFFAVEYLHSIDPDQPRWEIPASVRDLLHRRLSAASEAARQLLAAAAVIGRAFDFSLLKGVSGRSEAECVDGLEELAGRGLMTEEAGSSYDFTHHMLRSLAYAETSQARRRLLHLRAAEALASILANRKQPGPTAAQAASHFQAAGEPARAAEYFILAAENERRLYANAEALEHYQAALAAGAPDPAAVHEAIGDLQTLGGDYPAAIASYRTASAFCQPGCFSNLMHKSGIVYGRRGEWDQAEAHFEAACEAAGPDGDPSFTNRLLADWGLVAHLAGRRQRASDLAQRALQQAETGSSPAALAQALNLAGILERAAGDLAAASGYLERSLEAASQLEDPSARCAVLNNLGRVCQERGQLDQALAFTQQALTLCVQLGDRHRQAALHNNLADLYHAAGRSEDSMQHLKQAVSLFAEIGETTELPEIWKLTEW